MAEKAGSGDSPSTFPGPSMDQTAACTEQQQGEAEAIQKLYQELLGKTSHYLRSEFEGLCLNF
jgi:hypothetical protein